jgi:hypothetical protein
MTEKKALPQRSGRGNRMQKLIEQQEQEEDEFWNQEYWKEEQDDVEFSSDEVNEEEDVVDEDFDDPEAEVVEALSDDESADVEKQKKVGGDRCVCLCGERCLIHNGNNELSTHKSDEIEHAFILCSHLKSTLTFAEKIRLHRSEGNHQPSETPTSCQCQKARIG